MLTPTRQAQKRLKKSKQLRLNNTWTPPAYNPRALAQQWHEAFVKTMTEYEIYYNGERMYYDEATGHIQGIT